VPYLPEHLGKNNGDIFGCKVNCVRPEWLLKFHTGYAVDKEDYQDVLALCKKFKFPLPPEYRLFEKKQPNETHTGQEDTSLIQTQLLSNQQIINNLSIHYGIDVDTLTHLSLGAVTSPLKTGHFKTRKFNFNAF